MPNRRLGFGQQRVRNLVKYINEYISNYDASPIQVQAALNDLAEYLAVHKKASFALPEDIVKGIENLMRYRLDEQENFSIPCTAESYFVEDVDFENFLLVAGALGIILTYIIHSDSFQVIKTDMGTI